MQQARAKKPSDVESLCDEDCWASSSAMLRRIIIVLAIVAASAALPAPRLGNIWSDEMALQHGLPFNVSGFAHPLTTLIPMIDNLPAGSPSLCGEDGIFVVEFFAQPATTRDLKRQQGHVRLK
jgi:hypothetical protein